MKKGRFLGPLIFSKIVWVNECFFHLSSKLWKHIQETGLQAYYWENPEFSLLLRIIEAADFIPPTHRCGESIWHDDNVTIVFSYCRWCTRLFLVKLYWLRVYKWSARTNNFSNCIWNLFYCIHEELLWINNAIKG